LKSGAIPEEPAQEEIAPVDDGDARQEQVDDELLRQVFGDRLGQAEQYHELLAGRAVEWGLLGPRENDRLWSRHILNCAAIQGLIGSGMSVVDVGSGAGLPGIPLALARPDLRVTLLDSLLRRVTFLQLAIEELALTEQVDVVRARAEEATGSYGVVVARAVAPLGKLVRWCEPLMGAELLALKGEKAAEELADARQVLRVLGMNGRVENIRTSPGCPDAVVVIIERA